MATATTNHDIIVYGVEVDARQLDWKVASLMRDSVLSGTPMLLDPSIMMPVKVNGLRSHRYGFSRFDGEWW
jgi:hypothetical protein